MKRFALAFLVLFLISSTSFGFFGKRRCYRSYGCGKSYYKVAYKSCGRRCYPKRHKVYYVPHCHNGHCHVPPHKHTQPIPPKQPQGEAGSK